MRCLISLLKGLRSVEASKDVMASVDVKHSWDCLGLHAASSYCNLVSYSETSFFGSASSIKGSVTKLICK